MLVYNNRKIREDTAERQQQRLSRPKFANFQLSLIKIGLPTPFPIKIEGRIPYSLMITCLQFKGMTPEALVKTALKLKLEKNWVKFTSQRDRESIYNFKFSNINALRRKVRVRKKPV